MLLSILKSNVCDLQHHLRFKPSVFFLQWGCLWMSSWYTCLLQNSELREMLLLLSKHNVLKLPMFYHVSPQTNGTLKPRTFFCVGPEVLCPAQLPKRMGVSGLSARPCSSQWPMVWKLTTVPLLVSLVWKGIIHPDPG